MPTLPNMPPTAAARRRVFISYKRNTVPDEPVARAVYEAVSLTNIAFIDQTMVVGTDWSKRIEEEVLQADYLIVFLSAESIASEMVQEEIRLAHYASKEQGGPTILPVRLAYTDPFPYSLGAYLNHINWAYWRSEEDTPRLIDELLRAIAGETLTVTPGSLQPNTRASEPLPTPFPSAQPVPLERPDGTMDAESRFYVKRPSDATAMEVIGWEGVTIPIKGPRQMGKSSLLMRTIAEAMRLHKRVAFLDFQLFERSALNDADTFYRQFISWLTEELGLDDRTEEYWSKGQSNPRRCSQYMSGYLLPAVGRHLVLAMDEVESIFDTAFRSDFFAMLRSWHNARASVTTPIWKKLDLVLVTSTEPYELIEDLNQSPFNVGEVIEIADFEEADIGDLNRRHGSPFSEKECGRLMTLVGGQPYLTRRALYLVASGRIRVEALFETASDDRGPFGDHLRYHLLRIHDKEPLTRALRQVINNRICQDDETFRRLQGAGLVKRVGTSVVPRCELYERFFGERLHG